MAQATQSRHPTRAWLRTVVAVAIILVPALPAIADELGVATYPIAAAMLAGIAAVTRVLAIPAVNEALRRSGLLQWLAAEPTPAGAVRQHPGQPPV